MKHGRKKEEKTETERGFTEGKVSQLAVGRMNPLGGRLKLLG